MVAAALPEEIPVNETIELEGRLREELGLALEFLRLGSESDRARRWEQYAQMLLASNEALYVD